MNGKWTEHLFDKTRSSLLGTSWRDDGSNELWQSQIRGDNLIIWLASYPRSGNGFSHRTLKRRFRLNIEFAHLRSQEEIQALIGSNNLYIVKTHHLPKDDYPAIYLVRDGRDCYVSYTHFLLRHELGDEYDSCDRTAYLNRMQELIRSTRRFGGWSQHVLQWTSRSSLTKVLYFREFTQVEDPAPLYRDALIELGYDPGEPKENPLRFEDLQKENPHLFRRGQTGSHRDEMPPELEALFWEHHGEAMHKMNFSK